MTNPSPRNAKDRAKHREEHSSNSYYRRTILDVEDENQGRHSKPFEVVWQSAKPYPELPAGSPWHDDPTLAKSPHGKLASVLSAMSEAELQRDIAQASYEQKTIDPADPRVDDLQARIDAARWEQDRRRRAVREPGRERGARGD